jgi:dethiobiotin synthetase
MVAVPHGQTVRRPETLVVVAGTATEVGKTWAACRLIAGATDRGVRVAARKPVQSFDPDPDGAPAGPTDADLLGRASGAPAVEVCPAHRWYPRAMAPPMAAEVLGLPVIAAADLVAETVWPAGTALGVVETAGGMHSPVAHDASSGELLRLFEPDLVVLVADAALGVINAVRSALLAVPGLPVVVVLNRYDSGSEVHVRSRRWLEDRDGVRTVIDPLAVLPAVPEG